MVYGDFRDLTGKFEELMAQGEFWSRGEYRCPRPR